MSIDESKVEQFVGQVVGDLGATVSSALAHVGHRLGLYRAMAGAGPSTPDELAERTATNQRLVREWCNNQAAGGYLDYDPASQTYELPAEHAVVLANEDSPVYMAEGWQQMASVWAVREQLEAAFQSGDGLAWHDQDPGCFGATAGFFGPAYRAHLVDDWIPALEGVQQRLEAGGRVADVGCGRGVSTILLAQAFPQATLTGFDYHEDSIDVASKQAADAGLHRNGRLDFEVATAQEYPAPARGYDLICFFDALHDFGDPVGAAAHARDALADDGTVMLVEVKSEDRTEDNLNPLGRIGYGMSTFVCTPNALAQDGDRALGGVAGPEAIGEVLEQAGFSQFRKVAEAPVHQVLEARP